MSFYTICFITPSFFLSQLFCWGVGEGLWLLPFTCLLLFLHFLFRYVFWPRGVTPPPLFRSVFDSATLTFSLSVIPSHFHKTCIGYLLLVAAFQNLIVLRVDKNGLYYLVFNFACFLSKRNPKARKETPKHTTIFTL